MHDGHRERLRERYRRAGPNAFEDHELLELLLFYAIPRRDTNAIAHSLLDSFGSLSAVLYATEPELRNIEGVGGSAAMLLNLIGELNRRCALREGERVTMETRGAVAEYCYGLLCGRKSECAYALLLDARFHLISARLISEGLPDRVALPPRKVVEAAIAHGAVHVVIAHNHPAGDSTPSPDDIELTNRVRDALQTVGISLAEHIIVTDEDTFAVLANGRIPISSFANARSRAPKNTAKESDRLKSMR